MKKFITLVLIAIVTLATIQAAGCHTVEGAGRDIEEAGEAIQEATK